MLGRWLLLVSAIVVGIVVAGSVWILIASSTVAPQGGDSDSITQDEAVELATANASFTPCSQPGCVVVRAVQQGIPPRLVWIVGLAESLGPNDKPERVENYIVNAATGQVSRRP